MFVWNKEELPDQWKESIIIPIHKKSDLLHFQKLFELRSPLFDA
jgi:hypothetical protein